MTGFSSQTPTRKRHHLRTANEGGGTSDEAWAVNNHVQSTMYHSTAESASSPNSNEVSVPSTRQSSGEINTENDGQYVNMKETTLTGSRLVIENLPIRSKVSPVS